MYIELKLNFNCMFAVFTIGGNIWVIECDLDDGLRLHVLGL